RPGHARRLDLRPRPDGGQRRRLGHRVARRVPERAVKGTSVRIGPPPRAAGRDIPTLCWGDTLTPKNACRVCMVEVEGARVLAPACSRKVEPGMVVRTDSPRARHARRLVLEFLG